MIESVHQLKAYLFTQGVFDYFTTPIIPAEVAVRIRSCLYHQTLCPVRSKSIDKDTVLVERVRKYLIENIAEPVTLEGVAQAVASNRNTLAQAFKKVMGQGVFSWLRTQRMQQAAYLLRATQQPIQLICFDVGYREPANFSTTFKRYYGLSPQQYRKKMSRS